MTKQYFIEKWISWVSYTDREKLYKEMEADLESVSKALRIHDVAGRSEQLSCEHRWKEWEGPSCRMGWRCSKCKEVKYFAT